MSERDELAAVMVGQHVDAGYEVAVVDWYAAREMADAILEAGWKKGSKGV